MAYQLSGEFIEACDCAVVCPCWVDEDPDEGHCTGAFAWLLAQGSIIDGVDVGGLAVSAVTTHLGNRRAPGSATVIFVDQRADDRQFELLADAFAGLADGPLADLAEVTGVVLARRRAEICLSTEKSSWSLTVRAGAEPVVTVGGRPERFEDQQQPLTLSATALHAELGIGDGPVTVQRAGELALRVGALAGGYLEVSGRSAMRGPFGYRCRP